MHHILAGDGDRKEKRQEIGPWIFKSELRAIMYQSYAYLDLKF